MRTLWIRKSPKKSPKLRHNLNFGENAKFWESRPDSARSAEIPQNPGKCKSAGQFCINPTLCNQFLYPPPFFPRDEREARASQSLVGKNHREKKLGLQTDHHRPAHFFMPVLVLRGSPCILTFLGGFFECSRRFGAISLNLASAAEESGLIPAEMECGLSWLAAEGKVMRIWKATLLHCI